MIDLCGDDDEKENKSETCCEKNVPHTKDQFSQEKKDQTVEETKDEDLMLNDSKEDLENNSMVLVFR